MGGSFVSAGFFHRQNLIPYSRVQFFSCSFPFRASKSFVFHLLFVSGLWHAVTSKWVCVFDCCSLCASSLLHQRGNLFFVPALFPSPLYWISVNPSYLLCLLTKKLNRCTRQLLSPSMDSNHQDNENHLFYD